MGCYYSCGYNHHHGRSRALDPRPPSQVRIDLFFLSYLLICRASFFERHHRFAGWLSVVFVWIFVCLSRNLTPEGQFVGAGSQIIRTQEFWYALFITIL